MLPPSGMEVQYMDAISIEMETEIKRDGDGDGQCTETTAKTEMETAIE